MAVMMDGELTFGSEVGQPALADTRKLLADFEKVRPYLPFCHICHSAISAIYVASAIHVILLFTMPPFF